MDVTMQTTNSNDPSGYLAPGRYVDSDHPAVIAFARRVADLAMTPREIAVKLYYAVRDEFLYDPYYFDTTVEGLKGSHVIEAGRGFCVPKAALLAAAARALGVPARLGYADVRNHLTSKRLYDMMGTDLFVFHGYTELWVDGQWLKATPAFNRSLCEKAGIRPLEFDGSADSVFHEFDVSGRRHMEYVHDHGTYADLPREELLATWREHYKSFADWGQVAGNGADFAQEVGKPS
ncbi:MULTISPECIES: transglutaminase-like domain-containing protein [unclassified Polaromonas]|uniref:transglutaminase-like domain-containing protein n=2 Tax=Polaromonas TaxID=52972 RepID=UPI000BBC823F|nr:MULTISPECIES: transglutaminase family protein [unclassified Polaromonas]MDI1274789.1 transglutaminase family protein [Polaromonas sp.]